MDDGSVIEAGGIRLACRVWGSPGAPPLVLLAGDHPERVGRLILEDVGALLPRERIIPERPDGELPYDWEMVLAIRRQIDDPPLTRRGLSDSVGSPRRPW